MIVQYIRDKKRNPRGVVVAVDKDQIGWSYCNKKDRFNKERGKQIATDRAFYGYGPNVNIPYDVIPVIDRVKERAKHYFREESHG